MATALKHKQRSHRSYQNNRKVMGSLAVESSRIQSGHQMHKRSKQSKQLNWLDRLKQLFEMQQKGER